MPTILPQGDSWYVSINNHLIECETYAAALELAREYLDE